MQNASYDPGLTTQVIAPLRRIINKDGQFNRTPPRHHVAATFTLTCTSST